ncbi:MAG: VIT1/CCC1 transporter family protein [Actinomycetota bacterium]
MNVTGGEHRHRHMVHRHRDVQGGNARAAVFGVSDGLVSNVALILGVAGASTDGSLVRLAGVSGLLAGAISMAAGEWVSVRAQNELIERELEIERRSLADNPEAETRELAAIYRDRGLDPDQAAQVAEGVMADPEVALDVHAREELGVAAVGSARPLIVASSSFAAFAVGAIVPLVPWFVADGTEATVASVVLGALAAIVVGWLVGTFTERSRIRAAARQLGVAVFACAATFIIGSALGVSVS